MGKHKTVDLTNQLDTDDVSSPASGTDDPFDVLSEGEGDSMVFNLEDFEAPKFEVAPPGIYDAVVKDVQPTTSKAGNLMIVWQLEAPETPVGKRVFFLHHVYVKEGSPDPQGLGRIKETIVAIDPDFDLRTFSPSTVAFGMVGRPCRVKVTTQKYNGQDTNNVRQVLPAGEENLDSFLQ